MRTATANHVGAHAGEFECIGRWTPVTAGILSVDAYDRGTMSLLVSAARAAELEAGEGPF